MIGTLVVGTTFRLTYAIQLIAALAVPGPDHQRRPGQLGDDGSQNATALTLQPWAALLAAIAIAVLTVGIGLVGDGLARTAARIDRGS